MAVPLARLLLVACVVACLWSSHYVHGMTGMSITDLVKSLKDVRLFVGPVEVEDDLAAVTALTTAIDKDQILAGLSIVERVYVLYSLIYFERKLVESSGNNLTSIDILQILNPTRHIELDPEDVDHINETLFEDLQLMNLSPPMIARRKRKVTSSFASKWPSTEIPYRLSSDVNSTALTQSIANAIQHWQTETCLTFTQVGNTFPGSHLIFRKLVGCWSYVGKKSYPQIVSVSDGCGQFPGVVIKLIGHALGFWNEHQRPDRDTYITVNTSNIQIGNLYLFIRRNWADIVTYGIPYDYASLYHYDAMRFTNNPPNPTITPNDPAFIDTIGPKNELSFYDAKLANFHYCQDRCPGGLTSINCKNDGYLNPRNCGQCKCPEGLSGDCTTPAADVNVNCGTNNLFATTTERTLNSTGVGTVGYSANQECSWLITAGENEHIRITLQYYNLSCLQPCGDYLEVRTNTLAQSGPRLCCELGSGASPVVYTTSGNQALINFRTLRNSPSINMGFRLTYRKEPCGGCDAGNPNSTSGPACVVTESYSCMGTYRGRCGSSYCIRYRLNTCYRKKKTCCHGFTLVGNTCQRTVGQWTDWSTCTTTCGGCGTQNRTRSCYAAHCSEALSETRACNNNVCPTFNYYYSVFSYRRICGWWYWRRRYCIRYYAHLIRSRCCKLKRQVGFQCV